MHQEVHRMDGRLRGYEEHESKKRENNYTYLLSRKAYKCVFQQRHGYRVARLLDSYN